jgi:hypothetical protein
MPNAWATLAFADSTVSISLAEATICPQRDS